MHTGIGDGLYNFRNFWTSVNLTLDPGQGHIAVHVPSYIKIE